MNFKRFIIPASMAFLLLISSHLMAQHFKMNLQEHDHQRYHFGFFVATNQMDFSLKTNQEAIGKLYSTDEYTDFVGYDAVVLKGVHSEATMGFTVGIIGSLKVTKFIDLRCVPSLAFGERILNYSIERMNTGESPELVNIKKNIISTHVDIPFYVKYKSKRWNNFRAYLISGVKFSIDMAANSDKNKEQNEDLIRLDGSDISFEAGAGIDYYFDFFKFSIEMKMAYGINNLLSTNNNIYSDAIERLNSKIFQLSLTFE